MLPDDHKFTDSPSDSQTDYSPAEQAAYQVFLSAFNHGNLKSHFDSDRPPKLTPERITFYLKGATPPVVIGHLASQHLAAKVAEAVRAAWGDDAPGEVAYAVGEPISAGERDPPYYLPIKAPGYDRNVNGDEYQAVYYGREAAIIQPDKLEYNQATQYFRREWRPLLGPLLSELVRELRQRCHYQKRRDTFKATYSSLAASLGVNVRTIKRALRRDEAGQFESEYLGYFIAEMKVVQEPNGRGGLRTLGTHFRIYLADTLTPEDRRAREDKA